MIEIVRDHCRRVKRWSSAEMALRWTAAGMLATQTQFRRVKGYRELPQLAAALKRVAEDESGLLDVPRLPQPEPMMQPARRTSPKFLTKRDILT